MRARNRDLLRQHPQAFILQWTDDDDFCLNHSQVLNLATIISKAGQYCSAYKRFIMKTSLIIINLVLTALSRNLPGGPRRPELPRSPGGPSKAGATSPGRPFAPGNPLKPGFPVGPFDPGFPCVPGKPGSPGYPLGPEKNS